MRNIRIRQATTIFSPDLFLFDMILSNCELPPSRNEDLRSPHKPSLRFLGVNSNCGSFRTRSYYSSQLPTRLTCLPTQTKHTGKRSMAHFTKSFYETVPKMSGWDLLHIKTGQAKKCGDCDGILQFFGTIKTIKFEQFLVVVENQESFFRNIPLVFATSLYHFT